MAGRRGKQAAKSKAGGATRGGVRGGNAAGTQASAREVVTDRDTAHAALAAALREHARTKHGGNALPPTRAARPESVEIPTLRGADTVTSKKLLQGLAKRDRLLDAAITAWTKLDREMAEARLFPLAQFMGDVYAGALLIEQAAWERAACGGERKALVARLYTQRYLADRGALRGIDADSDEALERFDELFDGALRL